MPGMSARIKAKKGRFGADGLVPTLRIISPDNGYTVAANGSPIANVNVVFRGEAFDDAGDVSSSITWTSNIDGLLGSGKVLTSTLTTNVGSPLLPQVHIVTASITVGGDTTTATVKVTVTP